VARAPAQFGIDAGDADEVVKRLRDELTEELSSRELSYTASDGSERSLTLEDVLERKKQLEMAYNPNDCIEIRWAAPEGSKEMATCNRHAPAEQRKRMQGLRHWFSERDRPAN
jgi:hypothetical protein